MSYQTGTTHYNLPQTTGTDKRDWADTNQAFADVDAALYGAATAASGAATDVAGALTRIGTLETKMSSAETAITGLEGAVNTQGTAISGLTTEVADVRTDITDNICAVKEATATATYAHAVGEYFYYNDILYKTTTAIAINDTIVPNTNCKAVTIVTEVYRKYDIVEDFTVDTTKQLTDVLVNSSLIPSGFTLQGYYLPVMIMKTGDASVHFAYIRRDDGKLYCGESDLPAGNYLLNATCLLE